MAENSEEGQIQASDLRPDCHGSRASLGGPVAIDGAARSTTVAAAEVLRAQEAVEIMAADGGDAEFLVLKFGGTSVSTAANWRRIAAIVRQRIEAGGDNLNVVLVHSALSGVTDKLQRCLEQVLERRRSSDTGNGPHDAQQPSGTHKRTLTEIMTQHTDLIQALGLPEAEAQVMLAPYHKELQRVLEGASLISEVSSRTKARVVAMGELLSTTIGAAALSQMLPEGMSCWLEARELLRCAKVPGGVRLPEEQAFLSAACDFEPDPELQARLASDSPRVFVTQGFIASNNDGDTVLLGRGGSDTSAAYLAAMLQASFLEIWTDVPGMFTANPRLIPHAKLLRTLSFEEAQELASTGAKILHPRCIGPAVRPHPRPRPRPLARTPGEVPAACCCWLLLLLCARV